MPTSQGRTPLRRSLALVAAVLSPVFVCAQSDEEEVAPAASGTLSSISVQTPDAAAPASLTITYGPKFEIVNGKFNAAAVSKSGPLFQIVGVPIKLLTGKPVPADRYRALLLHWPGTKQTLTDDNSRPDDLSLVVTPSSDRKTLTLVYRGALSGASHTVTVVARFTASFPPQTFIEPEARSGGRSVESQ